MLDPTRGGGLASAIHRISRLRRRFGRHGPTGGAMEGASGEQDEAGSSSAGLSESEVVARLPGVRAMILRMTRDPTLTSDLTQDVLVAVVIALREGRIRQPEALAAYMHQSARHIVYAAHRRAQPMALAELPEQEAPMWHDRQLTPLEQCEEDELRRIAHEVLAELPAQRDRDLLTGFYIDGAGKSELMHRLELTADQFDKVIFRARSRMRERLREKLQETGDRVRELAQSALPMRGIPRSE